MMTTLGSFINGHLNDIPSGAVTTAADVEVTVGHGGDFPTINAALSALSRLAPAHKPQHPDRAGGLHATILLLPGFVMAEQVFVHRQNLGWIAIRAVDPVVTIRRSALTVTDWGGTQAAFYGRDGATMPVIACLFSMDTTGAAAQQTGMTLESSFVVFEKGTAVERNGIVNATYRGLNIHYGSRASLVFGDFSGAGAIGIRIANSSLGAGAYVKATDCGDAGASVGGAHANLDAGTFTGADIGIRAAGGATVSAGSGADVSGCGIGFFATAAAVIAAAGATATDCTSYGARAVHGGAVDIHRGDVSRAGMAGLNASHQGQISAQGCHANDCGGPGVSADAGGAIAFQFGAASNCQVGVAASSGGRVTASGATATAAALFGVHADGGGEVDVAGADLSGAGTNGIRCRNGSRVNASGANARRGAEDSASDVIVLKGGTVNAHDVTGGILQAKNIPTGNGVIFQA